MFVFVIIMSIVLMLRFIIYETKLSNRHFLFKTRWRLPRRPRGGSRKNRRKSEFLEPKLTILMFNFGGDASANLMVK